MKILTALFVFIVALLIMGGCLYYAVGLVIATYEATHSLFLVLFEIVVFCICAFGVTINLK